MAVTESFLVNTNSFNAIIEALIKLDEVPEEITDEFLISLGFESPSDLLVVHMLKELDMVTVDGEPTELYHKMTNPDTTDEAIATGLVRAYTDLFEQNREFHKFQKEDIHRELNEYFDGRKTDLIIKYMTNTLHKLVTYAGLNNVQKAVDAYFKDQPGPEQQSADEGVATDNEASLSKNGQEASKETEESSAENVSTETDKAAEEESEFDDVFFGDDEDEEKDSKQEEVTGLEEAEETETKGKSSERSINFDELPQVKKEEKGSKNIFDFFGSKKEEEEEEAVEAEAAAEEDTFEKDTADEADEADTDDKEIYADAEDEIELHDKVTEETSGSSKKADESKESLEQELLEINMESNNGYHTNGAENKGNPMANLTNIPTNEKIEKAIIKKAELLYKLERFEDVLPAYNDVISYFDDSNKDHLKEAVAKAVINRVAVLNKLEREDDLLPALDEVIERFEDSSVTEYYEHASMAMLQKSQLLEDGSPEELLSLYNAIIKRLKNASSPKIKNQVDNIFINRVDVLNENGSDEDLLNAVEDLIDRFKDSQLQNGQLEQAMYKRAEILENLNRDEEALEAYSEFIEKFGKTKEAV